LAIANLPHGQSGGCFDTDFVEKLIDGADLKPGKAKLEGVSYHLFNSPGEITPDKTPAALVGEDFSIEALTYQIASTPSFVMDEEALFISQIPAKEELLKAIKERV